MKMLRMKDLLVLLILVVTMVVQASVKLPTTLFVFLNSMCAQWPDAVWQNLTQLGDTLVLLCCMAPLLWIRPHWIYGFIAAIPLGSFLSLFFKKAFDAPRPGDVLSLSDFHAIAPVLSGSSFPSGHTITAFAFAAVLWMSLRQEKQGVFKRFSQILALLLAAGIGLSRIAMGVHWPQDVLSGACMGWLAGLSGVLLVENYQAFWRGRLIRPGVLCFVVISAIYVGSRSTHLEGVVAGSMISVFIAIVFQVASLLIRRHDQDRPLT